MLSRSGVLQGCAPRRIFISPAVGPTFGLTHKWAKSQGCDSSRCNLRYCFPLNQAASLKVA